METTFDELLGSRQRGILNNFQGATIHNLVINGNMTKSGHEYYYGETNQKNNGFNATTEEVAAAAKSCSNLMWGPASLAVIFGVARDIYHIQESATEFEQAMSMHQLYCPPGTIANTIRHNPYMKMHVSKWASMGAKKRVLKLIELFQNVMNKTDSEE